MEFSAITNVLKSFTEVSGVEVKDEWYKSSPFVEKAEKYDITMLDQPIFKTFDLNQVNDFEQTSQTFQKSFVPREYDENGNSNGSWTGESGNSTWEPNKEKIPDPMNGKNGNPDGLTWENILDKYEIDGITFRDGEPDFSEVMKDQVEIGDFTTDRRINFNQSDVALAEKWDMSPREVADWRKENNYTWHECKDCKTMQLVPCEVHNNIPHEGGIAVKKRELNN